jgi:vancomycin resistance protein YoaR
MAGTALLLTVVLGVSGSLFYIDRSYAGKIYPNVSIRGLAVGELTPEQAHRALEERFASFLAQPVTLAYGDQTWTPTLAELGVRLEIDRAVEEAYAAGRANGTIDNVRQVAAVWQNGLELPLRMTIDQDAMQRYLLGRVAEVDRPAVDAQLELDGTLTSVLPAAPGQQVLIAETLQEITAAVQSLDVQTIPLRTRELQPRLSDAIADQAQGRIASLLAGPLVLNVGDERFEWSLEDLARLVRIERVTDAGADTLNVSLDGAMIGEKIAALAGATEQKGDYPRVDWSDGKLEIIREGTSGQRIDEARAQELILTALSAPADQRELTLAMREVPPPVTAANLGQLGIDELLSAGRSDFSGSAPYRVTNIKAGMRLLHGILLAPGDEFSFNDSVGNIDASNGFVEGYAIIQNRTQLEWGGGICQDSTTMFRAAFWAGLPITERWGHSFYISWYDKFAFEEYGSGPGMDATIFTPGGPDLKFLNDTGHWLLIQSFTNGTTAEVRIYGTDDGRTVKLDGPTIRDRVPAPAQPVYVAEPSRPRGSPRQSDTARGGMTIDFVRIIERDGQVIERRNFQTKFKPWPDIFEVNPADLGPDGKPLPRATPTVDPATLPTPDPNAQPQPEPNAQPQPEPQPDPNAGQPALPTAQPIEPVPQPQPEPPPPTGGDSGGGG